MSALNVIDVAQEYGVSLRLNDKDELVAVPSLDGVPKSIIDDIKLNKYAVIDFLRAAKKNMVPQLDNSVLKNAPLTHVQKRLWLLEQRSKQPHVIRAVFDIKGAVDAERLRSVVYAVVLQNDILRVHIAQSKADVYQVINDELEKDDFYSFLKCDKCEIDTLIKKIVSSPFGNNDALFQVFLIELGAKEYRLVIKLHHLIADGVSIQILLKQISQRYNNHDTNIYNNDQTGRPNYFNFAFWETSESANIYYQPHVNYWTEQLQGYDALDLPRLAEEKTSDHVGASLQVEVPKPIKDAVHNIAQRHSVTENVVYLSAVFVLLSRYASKCDLVIGIPVANRFISEIESCIGFFVNTLPMRVNLQDLSTNELLKQVQAKLLQAIEHTSAPFDSVFEQLSPHDRQKNPFEVVFNYFSEQSHCFSLSDLSVEPAASASESVNIPLSLAIKVSPKQTVLNIDYDRYYFDEHHVTRLSGHVFSVISEFLVNKSISSVDLLSSPERKRILVERNAKRTIFDKSDTLQNWFEQQVKMFNNNVAVALDGVEMTYAELNKRANKLARYIRNVYQNKQGKELVKNTLIGICVDRSFDMVIGILAILKAGGAYVPMDVTHPEERLELIINDSAVNFVLSQVKVVQKFGFLNVNDGMTVIELDDKIQQEKISSEEETNLNLNYSPDDLAYVIYTSGSTGKPKGVMLSQHNVARLFHSTQTCFNFNSNDVWTLFHSYAFDMSVWEIFGALLYGGKLVIVPASTTYDFEEYHNLVSEHGVTILNQTPGAFQQFINVDVSKPYSTLKHVRYVTLAGDALNIECLRPWWNKYNDNSPVIVNMYGITETTVHVTYGALKKEYLDSGRLGFIGHQLSDLQVYVLDEHKNLCPIGVPGELYVGGAGVARGYLNRDSLTNERFIPNPFCKELGLPDTDRIYKSGDLVRWAEDNELEYIGRTDFQVKIRGYRIELGEIESRLSNLDGIRECCVIVVNDDISQKYIVAYYVPEQGAQLKEEDLREHLLKQLPGYMLPKQFLQINSMPLTQNNKIDRKSLPKPTLDSSRDELTIPDGSIEKSIAEIWKKVLNITSVSRESNFFYLGGDSISLMQVVALLRQDGLLISVRDFFEAQTLQDIARKVVIQRGNGVPIKSTKAHGAQIITPIQRWFFEGNQNPSFSNQLFRLKVLKDLDINILKKAVDYLVNYHDVFALKFFNANGVWSAEYQSSAKYIFENHDLSSLSFDEQALELERLGKHYHASLDINAGVLSAFVHFKLGHNNERLLVIVNHLIVDGVSWRILVEDLSVLYSQMEQKNLPQVLLQKTTSYQNWSSSISEYSVSNEAQAFWENFSVKDSPNLPCDIDNGENNYGSSARFRCVLDKVLTQKLLTDTLEQNGAKINALLLAVLSSSLQSVFGVESMLVDMESHGRSFENNSADLTRTVGWFTSIYPIALKNIQSENILDRILRIQTELDSIPNEGGDYLPLKYSEKNTPALKSIQSDISFNYLGQFQNSIFNESIFQMADEYYGEPVAPENQRRNKINIVMVVVDGELRMDWNYSENQFKRSTIKRLAEKYLQQLKSLI